MKGKVTPFSETLDRIAKKAGVIFDDKHIETAEDQRCLPYVLGGVGHLARWMISLEVADTPRGRRLFIIQHVPKGDDGMTWIGNPLDGQPPTPRRMTESELNEVRQLVDAIYRRGK